MKNKYIHLLVLEAFAGSRPDGMEALHIDGNKINNNTDNLRWGTSSENNRDIVRHGRHVNARKTHCPRGHALSPENTPDWYKIKGRRGCLACSRAKDYIRARPELRAQLQHISDQYYAKIMSAADEAH